MKHLIATILSFLLVLTLVGCGQETQQEDPLVQAYKENAQKYITAGDFDTAIAILEDGLIKTNQNSGLAAMLEQAKSQSSHQNENTPDKVTSSGFAGYWESENACIGIEEHDSKFSLLMVCCSLDCFEYTISSSVDSSSITETKVVFPFEDDGYGGSGKVSLYLEGDTLNYVITDFVAPGEDYGIGIECGGGSLHRVEKMPLPLESLKDGLTDSTATNDENVGNTEVDEDDVYVGDWADIFSERATMIVTKTAGKYSIKIEWADGSAELTTWTMTAVEKYEDGDCWLSSTDCKKTVTVYAENGQVSKEVEYENGKAMIYYMDETLNWVDYTEYAGDNCCFEKIP